MAGAWNAATIESTRLSRMNRYGSNVSRPCSMRYGITEGALRHEFGIRVVADADPRDRSSGPRLRRGPRLMRHREEPFTHAKPPLHEAAARLFVIPGQLQLHQGATVSDQPSTVESSRRVFLKKGAAAAIAIPSLASVLACNDQKL